MDSNEALQLTPIFNLIGQYPWVIVTSISGFIIIAFTGRHKDKVLFNVVRSLTTTWFIVMLSVFFLKDIVSVRFSYFYYNDLFRLAENNALIESIRSDDKIAESLQEFMKMSIKFRNAIDFSIVFVGAILSCVIILKIVNDIHGIADLNRKNAEIQQKISEVQQRRKE